MHLDMLATEKSVRVGRSTSILDQVYYDPKTNTNWYIEAKSGYPYLEHISPTDTKSKHEMSELKLQVVRGCLSWNKALEFRKKNNNKDPRFNQPISKGYLFFVDWNIGPLEVKVEEWDLYKQKVEKGWRLGKSSVSLKK